MYFYAGSKIKFYHSPHFAITTLLPRPIRSGATPLRAALARPRRKRTREAYYRFTGVLFECNFASRGAPFNLYTLLSSSSVAAAAGEKNSSNILHMIHMIKSQREYKR